VSENSPVLLGIQVADVGEGPAYSVSDSGVLAYISGNHQYERRLVWVDRHGNSEPLPVPLRGYVNPAIAPNGRNAAVDIIGPTYGIWIYDFARTTLTPLTSGGSSQAPSWAPDGQHIAYRATRAGFRNLFWKASDGNGDEERLSTSENIHTPASWSPDGKRLVFVESNPATSGDILVLPLDGDRKPQVFLKTPFSEQSPHVSPNGHWLAYSSNESSGFEIYVRPFPGPGAKLQISTNGGTEPIWSRDGRELFYINGDKMMAVDVSAKPTLTAGPPHLLFTGRFLPSTNAVSAYDVSLDGRRFLKVQSTEADETASRIDIVINWFQELKQRESSQKRK